MLANELVCEPCKSIGIDRLAHYKPVKAGMSPNGKARPAMCWDHYHGKTASKTAAPVIDSDEGHAIEVNEMPEVKQTPASIALFKPGGTEEEFTRGLGTLMRDVLEGKVEPAVAESACKVADKIIRVMELRIKLQALSNQ